MQEEKNQQQNGDRKKHKNHRHGYFIQPPTNEVVKQGERVSNPQGAQAQQKQHNSKPNPPRQNGEAARNDKPAGEHQSRSAHQGGRNNHYRKRNHKQDKSRANAEDAVKVTSDISESAPQPSPAVDKKPNAPEQKSAFADKASRGRQSINKDSKPQTEHSADDYEAYKLVVDEAEDNTDGNSTGVSSDNGEQAAKTEVVGIRFKSMGKVYYFDPNGHNLKSGVGVIVDTARGQEYGEVAMANSLVSSSEIVPPLRVVIRPATKADVDHHAENKAKEAEAFRLCQQKIADHGLEMKLVDAQYTFDNTKLLFYFTSSNRVDFRDLVKDLASVFRTRIELRQIGIRDEAKLTGGLGMCGRPLCCTLFLYDFDQVSIKMAKEQNLSLNSAKISGICGRLMCCLKYEHEAYEYEIKRTPPVDSLVRTENGDGIVTEISPLQGTIKVRLLASPEVPPKTYHRDAVMMLRKKQSTENN